MKTMYLIMRIFYAVDKILLAPLLLLFILKKLWWRFVDVGGHVPERRKWEAIIENVHSIDVLIYFAALDDFLIDSEEKGKTQMDMSIKIWEESLNDQALSTRKSTILFLNKMDLFEELFQKKKFSRNSKNVIKIMMLGRIM